MWYRVNRLSVSSERREKEREKERLVRKLLAEESSFESNERGEKEDRGGVLIKTRGGG